jgi:hypothetical protein
MPTETPAKMCIVAAISRSSVSRKTYIPSSAEIERIDHLDCLSG